MSITCVNLSIVLGIKMFFYSFDALSKMLIDGSLTDA